MRFIALIAATAALTLNKKGDYHEDIDPTEFPNRHSGQADSPFLDYGDAALQGDAINVHSTTMYNITKILPDHFGTVPRAGP